ncbi:MAG: hypothetical protein L0G99_11045 [Propionibacteriales bacterium]|nr:hypothetical protein [Propionibacteriales bacterium]
MAMTVIVLVALVVGSLLVVGVIVTLVVVLIRGGKPAAPSYGTTGPIPPAVGSDAAQGREPQSLDEQDFGQYPNGDRPGGPGPT